VFLCTTPFIGVFGTLFYALKYGVAWWEPTLLVVMIFAVGCSIGSGYHRYFSHRTYEAHPIAQAFFLIFGSMAMQNSALSWSRDHRDHHRFEDKEFDPYNINRGFWWAHMFWIFYKADPRRTFKSCPDLLKNRLVMLQHRVSGPFGLLAGLALPTLVGAAFGRPLGGLLWGGFLRIFVIHHTTFFVNSASHVWGVRPYSEGTTARDNWFLAFFTHGEGYHNFHHRFPADFRNGIRWWHWDPNKWLIRGMKTVGLARALNVTPEHIIEAAKRRVELAKEAAIGPLPGELAPAAAEA
jgi:stearoyl-CoA desaturase (delta-9 desaturase)